MCSEGFSLEGTHTLVGGDCFNPKKNNSRESDHENKSLLLKLKDLKRRLQGHTSKYGLVLHVVLSPLQKNQKLNQKTI